MFKTLFQSGFVRNVSLLAGGTAFAQGIAILALPVLTRIYSPNEFGILGIFTALLGMISVIATLRYEIAIPLPESDQSAANLLGVALVCVAATTVAVVVIVNLFGQQIVLLMKAPLLAKYLWLLPIAIAATGAYSVFQFWATRKKAFKRIARTRVEQSIGGVTTQLLMGWTGTGALGLIVGQIVSNGAGFFGLARRAFSDDRTVLQGVGVAGMRAVAREYDRFPKFSTFEALTNSASVQMPIILIAGLTASAEVGYLMLALRIMQAPMGIIGSSISQVYFSRAVEEHRNDRLGDFTARTIGGLAKIGIGPLIFVGIIAPSVFGLIFGAEWQRAGELVAWMTPWFVLQFLVSPVSMSLHVTNNQRLALALQIVGVSLRVLMVLAAGAVLAGQFVAETFAISGFLFYVFYLMVVCRVVNVTFTQKIKILKDAMPLVVLSVLLAIVVRAVLKMF